LVVCAFILIIIDLQFIFVGFMMLIQKE